MEIQKHKNVTYKSVEAMLEGQAQVFVDRAKIYLDKGEIDRAIGCLNKAMVKIKRVNILKLSPLEEKMFGPMIKQMHDNIAKRIMEDACE
jgi:hypothetical protein